MICTSNFALFTVSCLVLLLRSESAPKSIPLKDDANIAEVIPFYNRKVSPKNYFNSTPHARKEVPIISYNSPDPDCNVGFKLAWSSSVASPVYATPVIFPAGSDGKKQIFLSTFHHHIEIIGHDGYKPPGWPLTFEDSTFQGSPMLYDIDGDGTNDVGVVDKNGNLFWIKVGDNGQYLENYHIQVPKLKIKRDWAAGLDPKFVDNYATMSMFDHKSDRDSSRQFEYAATADKPLFSSKDVAVGKAGSIRPDDLGSLVIKQDSYPELNKIIDSSKTEKTAFKTSIHGRKLQSSGDNEEGFKTAKDPALVNIPAVVSEPEDYNVDNSDIHHRKVEEVAAAVVPDAAAAAAAAIVVPDAAAAAAVVVVPDAAAAAAAAVPDPAAAAAGVVPDVAAAAAAAVVPDAAAAAAAAVVPDAAAAAAAAAEVLPDVAAAAAVVPDAAAAAAAVVPDAAAAAVVPDAAAAAAAVVPDAVAAAAAAAVEHDVAAAAAAEVAAAAARSEAAAVAAAAEVAAAAARSEAAAVAAVAAAAEVAAAAAVAPEVAAAVAGETSFDFVRSADEATDDYIRSQKYDGRGRGGRAFDDGMSYYSGSRGSLYNDSNYVFVDPHVLGSPVLVDVNNDGNVEVLVAVSYYFDKEEYAGRELDFDPSLYVAGGMACWNLQLQDWTWLVHLDLTTDKTKFKALVYSTPTVADLEGDGRSEIILGTSMGLLYVLEGDTGTVKRFFPLQFHEIQAQVAVASVLDGPDLQMIVADMGGTLAVVDATGEIRWDANLSGTLPHTPTIGDVDGDGQLDIAIVAASADGTSHLWIVEGATGKALDGYPMALPAGVIASASVLLVDLHDYTKEARAKTQKMVKDKVLDPSMLPWMAHTYGYEPPPSKPDVPDTIALETIDANGTIHVQQIISANAKKQKQTLTRATGSKSKGLHIVVPTFDGHIYVIEGMLRCAERIDIGEHIYSSPVMSDITGDGFLDMVVGTLSGQVHLLKSSVPAHALNSWSSFPNGRLNGFSHGIMGVSVPLEQRAALSRASFITYRFGSSIKARNGTENVSFDELLGHRDLLVTFDIWDHRPSIPDRKYRVTFTKGTNKASPLATHEFSEPGRYTVFVTLYPPEKFVLTIGLTNEHGQYFEDTVPVELGTRFYVWMKYLLILPAMLLYLPLLCMRVKPKDEI